jgi:adenylate cyclase
MHIFYTDPSGKTNPFATKSEAILIGRQMPRRPGHLSLEDSRISGRHAQITFDGEDYWIEDLGSSNGTWIDKKKLQPHIKVKLTPGSTVLVGQTILRLEEVSQPGTGPFSGGPEEPPPQKPAEIVDAEKSLPDLFLAGASLETARRRLSAVCELSATLGEINNPDILAMTILEHLHRAFPNSGHSGLLFGDDLILKAFRPEDKPPRCSLTLARHVQAQKKGCLWQIDLPGVVDPSASLIDTDARSAMYTPLMWKGEILGVLYLDASSPQAPFDMNDLQLMQAIAAQAAMFIQYLSLQRILQREEVVKTRLLAQFPRPIAERLASQPGSASVVSERVETVTILFSDVRGFTKLTASLEPEEAVQMLNDMFHDLTPIVLANNGSVDKYIGDALLAVFGSPEPDDRQWEHAVKAALEMQEAIRRLGAERWKNRPAFRVGIGIHTGPAIHGFIGAPERMEYTVIGSTINSASRYCDAAGPGEILISPATYARLHRNIDVELPPREIETKHEGPMKAYLVQRWKGRKDTDAGGLDR